MAAGASADPRALYQRAVQTPEIDIDLVDRVFRTRRRRKPLSLREDFCGTALLSATWAQSDDERVAVGVDLDPKALTWSRAHVLSELDEDERERVSLVRADVRTLSTRTFDVIVAPNFSWAVLDDEPLAAYFASARRCLEDDGLFALELFGGSDLTRPLVHTHRFEGFTYLWEHQRFDEAKAILHAAIHFRLDDGRLLAGAFEYAFRIRPYETLVAMLDRVGFSAIELHVERPGTRFRRRARPPQGAAFNGYVMAFV